MHRYLAIANYEDRFVIPTTHREYAEDAYDLRNECGFSFGNGCSTAKPSRACSAARWAASACFQSRCAAPTAAKRSRRDEHAQ